MITIVGLSVNIAGELVPFPSTLRIGCEFIRNVQNFVDFCSAKVC